ncbi:MAG: hypothetical protein EOP86_21000 [Verrucomicrobiaceae bacterium]|nr:MAG: hypothetical protein EOP86_21000 [Verrucomicrobiaceae bacterium]
MPKPLVRRMNWAILMTSSYRPFFLYFLLHAFAPNAFAIYCAGRAYAQTSPAAEIHEHYYQQIIRGITIRVPKSYAEIIFGNDGFRIRAFAEDLRPYNMETSRIFPGNDQSLYLIVSVGGQRRFTGQDTTRRRIAIRATSIRHSPAEISSNLDKVNGPLVPQGLIYHQAKIAQQLHYNADSFETREDMFTLEEPQRSINGSALPEAIFCLSAQSPEILRRLPEQRSHLPCVWMMVWRDLEVSIFLHRRHLTRWEELRTGVTTLLDGFVVSGPAEAGPPPEPLIIAPPR